MTAPNHIVGGFTFTGILASIGGINILQDYRLLPVILIASLLPDIDHTRSMIGKLFLPVAKSINRRYGHRTITHSIFVWIGLTALVSSFQATYFPSMKIAQVFGLAYGSHLIFDMMTVQGVPLFFPFKKNACVIPGNPEMRLRTSNIRQETMVFCVFIMSAIFMKPLFANGFWTSYNRLFGSLKHIVSEYNKSSDLILVDFVIQHGSVKKPAQGFCLSVNTSKIVVLDENNVLQEYPKEGQLVSDLYPIHTGKSLEFRKGQFLNISIDSLKALFVSNRFSTLDIHANGNFLHIEDGVENAKQALKLSYPNALKIQVQENHTITTYVANPAIQTKLTEINTLEEQYNQKMHIYQKEQASYDTYKKLMEDEVDEVKKELLMIGFATKKQPKHPNRIDAKLTAIRAGIKQLQTEDYNQYQQEMKNNILEPLRFTGTYEAILIDAHPVDNDFDYHTIASQVKEYIDVE